MYKPGGQLQQTSDFCDCQEGFCHQVLSYVLFHRFTRRCVKLTCFGNAPGHADCLKPYRITPINWLMARKPPSTFSRRILYWQMCHLLLRFLCLHEVAILVLLVAILLTRFRSIFLEFLSICTSAIAIAELYSLR